MACVFVFSPLCPIVFSSSQMNDRAIYPRLIFSESISWFFFDRFNLALWMPFWYPTTNSVVFEYWGARPHYETSALEP